MSLRAIAFLIVSMAAAFAANAFASGSAHSGPLGVPALQLPGQPSF